jgi:hypothetical protein
VVGSDEVAASNDDQASALGQLDSSTGRQQAASDSGQPEYQASPASASATAAAGEPDVMLEPMSAGQQAGTSALSRAGEPAPDNPDGQQQTAGSSPRLLSGQLQQGSLSSGPLNLDALFLNDQPSLPPTPQSSAAGHEQQAPSEPAPSHQARPTGPYSGPHRHLNRPHNGGNSSHLNGRLNGWLNQHHNKFVPRPAATRPDHSESNLSRQLAANLQQLAPTPVPGPSQQAAAPAPSEPNGNSTGGLQAVDSLSQEPAQTAPPLVGALDDYSNATAGATNTSAPSPTEGGAQTMSMQTITRTYSTILETTRTRLVPMQVASSTGIVTITEDYIMTKMMTAYQTMPAMAEFILADQQQLSTRAPYEVFESQKSETEAKAKQAEPAAPAAVPFVAPVGPVETQEQPISLDSSPKSANNWLHDFTNLDSSTGNSQAATGLANDLGQSLTGQQQQTMLALLEQQARDANLAPAFPLMSPNGEPLDQLASQLDPSALLADGAINIPDLNNPLVLAAAIQNPQLAAVILAAQQLKFKRQQQQQHQQKPLLQQQQQQQLQPSFSTSFSTTIKPSTYTARDTMYTTRLVSFRDGRTVRTRTVSEPGSVVEQVLTTMVTETIPITIAIKPTAALVGAAALPSATAVPAAALQSNQATINNALFATQLANILARRQQQLQPSFSNSALMGAGIPGLQPAAAATPQQLLALQQFIGQQQKRQQTAATQQQQQQQQQQFQPNFQQLLQSMAGPNNATSQQANRAAGASAAADQPHPQATPSLQQPPKSVVSAASPTNVLASPLTTTLTSLQVRTYTVHNAFKTIFRTITSTVLIPTVLSAGSTLMPGLG